MQEEEEDEEEEGTARPSSELGKPALRRCWAATSSCCRCRTAGEGQTKVTACGVPSGHTATEKCEGKRGAGQKSGLIARAATTSASTSAGQQNARITRALDAAGSEPRRRPPAEEFGSGLLRRPRMNLGQNLARHG
jgi:hypothetical protein